MSNTGLKDYNKFLDYKIGGLEIKINLSNVNKNLLFISPLTLQIGKMPIDLSLIYNDLCKTNVEYFGKGIRSTLYKKITETQTSYWEVSNPDFTIDRFDRINGLNYLNYENRNVIKKEYDSSDFLYKLYDKEENVITYRTNSDNYYEEVNIKGKIKQGVAYSFPNSIIYSNAYNDNLTLNLTNSRCNSCYYRDSDSSNIVFETDLGYDNQNRLEEIIIKKYNDNEKLRWETIVYGTNSYTFIDNLTGNKIEINIGTNQTIINEYFLTTLISTQTINYYTNKTKVINQLGQETIYLFSSNGLLLTKLEGNMANGYVYNKTFKLPTLITNEFRVKNVDTSIQRPILTTFTTSNITTSTNVQISDSDLSAIITNPCELSGTGNIYLTTPIEGTSNDYLTFLIWMKEISISSNSSAYIELMINSDIERTYLNDLSLGNNYRLISVGIRPRKSYTSVRMLIHLTNSTLVMGGIQLLKKGFGKAIEYDELGNVIIQKDKLGTNSYSYNSNNKLVSASEYVGNVRNIEYNANSQVSYNMTRYGVVEKNEYDSSVMYNLTKKTYNTLTETFSEEYFYLNGKRLLKTKDEFLNETFYDYDTFENISNILRLNLDVIEYNYNNKNLLSSIIRNPDDFYEVCSYTYDDYRRISTLTTSSNSVYKFTYDPDDNYNNITEISLDNVTLMKFTYDNDYHNILTKITYGNDMIGISYSNNYKTISSISLNNNVIFSYTYDEELRLTSITDSDNTIIKTFTYDLEGKLLNQTIYGNSIEYKYQLDNLSMKIDNIHNEKFIETYRNKNEDLGRNPSTLEKYVLDNSNMYIATFSSVLKYNNEIINFYAKNKNNVIYPNYEQGMGNYPFTTIVGGINAYEPGKNGQYISYTTTSSASSDQMISVGAWIKPTNITNPYLFMIRRGTTIKPVIYIKIVNGVVKVDYEKESGTIETLITSGNLITLNNWHYVAFRYFKDYVEEDDYGYDIYCFELYIGMKKYTFYHTNSDYNFYNQTNLKYHLGYRMINGYVNDAFTGYMTGIIMGNGTYVSESFIKQYYLESFESLIKNSTTTSAVDFSSHTYYSISNSYPGYEIIPLRGNYESIDGLKPKICDMMTLVENYNNSSFSYNDLINSYAYTPKSLLIYNKNLGNQGTILLKMITYDTTNKEYIMELKNTNGKIELFIENDYLNINLFGNTYNTYYTVTKSVWHRVGISYSYSSSTISLRVFFDGYTVTRTKTLSTFYTDMEISVGASNNYGNASNVLFGQIVDFYLKSSYITQTTFNNVINSIYGISKSLKYDSLGRKTNDVIYYNSSTIINTSHTYDKTRVITDTIGNNTRSYTYNSRNFVETITDSTYGNHTYEYDERGYLKKDNNISYTYDGNGNILTAGSTIFTYDINYKDRLSSVSGNIIAYCQDKPYFPYTYNGMTFYYEGKRLKKVTLSSNEIEFYYDDEGIRYKKTVKENDVLIKTILYYYDGKQLLSEVENGTKKSYLYDSEGMIYGYVINNTSYYYIMDSLGIIHGVRNASGTIIETYTYDAYGNILSQSGSSTNNIKYKGYYYDEEIDMYYLLSRYYYPKWRRFLTPDNYTYLDLENINDLNLFAYCNNNPVMYSDGEGTFAILALALIGALVITGSIIEGNVEYEKWKKNGDIDINADYVEIKKSWLIQNPIASLVFTLGLTNSKEYKDIYNDNNPSKRNWFDMWLEWEGHNIVGNISASLTPIVAIPEFLLSNQIGTLGLIYTFRRCYDVYMENSEDWWKVWKHKK